jgi:cation diffusion facilitator family transporter
VAEHDGGKAAIAAAFAANLGIAIAKFTAFVFTGAASMLAESFHSIADTGNQALLMLGRARSQRAPDANHPFGYGRVRYFWAFVVALVLFTLGGVFAIYEGVRKLQSPEHVESVFWAIGTLLVAMALEGFSLRTAVRESRPLKGEDNWWQFIRHAKTPEFPVVILEDFGALIGLVFAMLGVVLATALHEPRYDALGSLAIGVLLVCIAATLAWETSSLLVGEGARPFVVAALREAMEAHDDVVLVIHMRTEHLGPDELLVAAKLEFRPGMTLGELAEAINATEARARAAVDERCVMYIEPDLYDEDRAPAAETEPR